MCVVCWCGDFVGCLSARLLICVLVGLVWRGLIVCAGVIDCSVVRQVVCLCVLLTCVW